MGILQCQECGANTTYHTQISIQRSPVPHLLQSYDVPNAEEVLSISNLLANARRTLSAVDAELQQVSAAWTYLREKRVTLQKSILRHDSLLAPIRRLPEDVLRHIFSLSLPSLHEQSTFDNVLVAPLLLTQVCEPWKQCAVSSQRLWASFMIKSDAAPQVSLVRTWLSHAKSISLSPCFKLFSTNAEARRAWPAVAEAIQYCDRWDNLTVLSPLGTLRRFGSVRGRLHSLYRLSITLFPGPGSPNHQILDAFEFAPRLRKLKLRGVSPKQLRLPWQQITSMELNSFHDDLSSLHSALQPLVNLAFLSIKYTGSTTYPPPLTPITLSHLTHLAIVMPFKIGNLCAIIRCPVLHSLSFKVSDHLWICGRFFSFFHTLLSLKVFEIKKATSAVQNVHAVLHVADSPSSIGTLPIITSPSSVGTMPTITSLSLIFDDMGSHAMSSQYFALLAALTHLHDLKIRIHPANVDDYTPARLIKYLLAVPTVTSFSLDCDGVLLGSAFISAMIYIAPSSGARDDPCLLPRLKSLDINVEFPYEHLMDVMVSRNGISGVAQLERVVPPDDIWNSADLLSRLEESGMSGIMQKRVRSE